VRVEKGWHGPNEVNRVVYDPARVSPRQMEEWLREAGTYIRTLDVETPEKGG
jgi:hypothetical protein